MKIALLGVNLPEGKVKYNDPVVKTLVEKCSPKKITPYYVEFIKKDPENSDAIITDPDSILDLIVNDTDKCELRIDRSDSSEEKDLMKKCIDLLENEKLLRACDFTPQELEILHQLPLLTMKPVLVTEDISDQDSLITDCLSAAEKMFFYTAGPQEVHAWIVDKGSEIVQCAGKIHTDLARGFIKGEIASLDDFLKCHSFNDCRKQGLVKEVDRDYIVEEKSIIEIKFNV